MATFRKLTFRYYFRWATPMSVLVKNPALAGAFDSGRFIPDVESLGGIGLFDTHPAVARGPACFIPELESLRGLSALAVVIFHCCSSFWLYPVKHDQVFIQLFLKAFFNGPFYVGLFFTLSGLALFVQLSRCDLVARGAWLAFWSRRIMRLMPAACASVLLASLVLWCLGFPNLDLNRILSSLFLQDFTLNPVLWSLNVEMVCSFFLPPALFVLLKLPNRLAWTMLTVFILFCFSGYAGRIGNGVTYLYVGYFFSGLICYHLGYRCALLPLKCQRVLWCVAAGLLPLSSAFPGKALSIYPQFFAVMLAITLAYTHSGARGTSILRLQPLRFLGKISFSLYLIHLPVFCVANHATWTMFPCNGVPDNLLLYSISNLCLTLGPSILFAWAIYRWVEVPSIRLSRKLTDVSCRAFGTRVLTILHRGSQLRKSPVSSFAAPRPASKLLIRT